MFCENCGAKLEDNAKFCTSCGINITDSTNQIKSTKIEDNEIVLTLKSTFKWAYKFLSAKILFFGFFPFVIPLLFIMFTEDSDPFISTFIPMVCITFLGSMLIYLLFVKAQYNSYRYDLYKTKIIYKDGFINKIEKEISYKNIKEITMKKNIFQEYFGIGTIIIYTTAENAQNNGIYILDIEDVDNAYKKVKEMINI